MTDGFTVVTSGLRNDAQKWVSWSEELATGRDSIADSFERWAFSDQPGFEGLRTEYFNAVREVKRILGDGVNEFAKMGSRLDGVAEIYDSVEETNQNILLWGGQ